MIKYITIIVAQETWPLTLYNDSSPMFGHLTSWMDQWEKENWQVLG